VESTTTSVALGPLLAAKQERERELRALLDDLIERIVGQCGPTLHAVLLSGSLGRGEAIAVDRGALGWALLSDIDLYVVGAQDPPAALRASLRERLRQSAFLLAGADVAFVRPAHFAGLGPTLPAAQLHHSLRTLWRGPLEWNLTPLPTRHVAADDALALIQNRAGELLLVHQRADSPERRLLTAYRELRLAMDGVLAWLAAEFGYEAERARREAQFTALLQASAADRVTQATWQSLLALHRRAVQGELPESDLLAAFAAAERTAPHRRFTRLLYAAMLTRFCDPQLGAESSLAGAVAMDEEQWRRATQRWLRRRGRLRTLREARRWAQLAPSASPRWLRYGGGGSGPERVRAACVELLCAGGEAASAAQARACFGAELRNSPYEAALATLWGEWMLGGRRL
jgi:hypothetical protein